MEDDTTILLSVFNKYSTDKSDSLSLKQFVRLISRLGKHVKELQGVEFSTAQAVFAVFNKEHNGKLTFDEFEEWWKSSDSDGYKYFTKDKSKLLRKAFRLYNKYTTDGAMTFAEFENMMDELDLPHTELSFDLLDTDDDGLLSFGEFCEWLHWF